MIIATNYTDKGALKPGLTPTIDIVRISDGVLVIDDAGMTAFANMTHAYYYDFTAYDSKEEYMITMDGGATLNDKDRYKFAGSSEGQIQFISDTEGGGWDRTGVQQIVTKPDNSTEVSRFNLFKRDGTPAQETDVEVHKRERV